MEIKQVDKGKNKDGYYFKYEIPKYDADGKRLSDHRIKRAILDHLHPVPVKIKKRKDTGYFEASIGSGYRHVYCPVLN
jgi:hypothetical protein